MKKENKCTRVKCNLLQAEVYVRFPVRVCEDKTEVTKYVELQKNPIKNGVIEEFVEVDYPITPEYVNSFADSADYRKNPDVIAQAHPKQNLGDVTEVQRILANDVNALRKTYEDLIAKIDKVKTANPGEGNPGEGSGNGGNE